MKIRDNKLILVSNAEPYAHERSKEDIKCEKLAGGLTSALDPLMQEVGGVWIVWGRGDADFDVLDSDYKVRVPNEDGYELKRLKLSDEEVNGFYLGFSNGVLWPICHSLLNRTSLENYNSCKRKWGIYREVNRKYATAIKDEINKDTLIWIHDYHLALLPDMIRKDYSDAKIGFFWHIPWPPWEIFGSLPWRKDIIDGLLASDFIGFHTSDFVKNFLSCVEKVGGGRNNFNVKYVDWDKSLVKTDRGSVKISSIPLGIDYDWFKTLSKDESMNRKALDLRERLPAGKIILSVDRLDYTKGIPERLKAFEFFLSRNPEFHGKVTLVQRIPPSRTSVEEYKSISRRINRIIGRINGKFEKADWTPIKSFHRFLSSQKELIPYYITADVALITPLMDGMNLVCKEFIASTSDGVLILSEFAGAAKELKDAIHVNPYNSEEVAQGIKEALTMTERERMMKLENLKKSIRENDLEKWRKQFIGNWLKQVDK